MAKHRYKYKIYTTSGEHIKVSCYDIFDEYGIENCTIELVEYFSCETKDELFRREGEYIRNNDCVNKIIAGRTKQEYNAETKEKSVKPTNYIMKKINKQYKQKQSNTETTTKRKNSKNTKNTMKKTNRNGQIFTNKTRKDYARKEKITLNNTEKQTKML